MMTAGNDYYKILQLHPECDQEVIPRMRKLLSMLFHPDIAPQQKKEEYTVRMQLINNAADNLSSTEFREKYNREHPYFQIQRTSENHSEYEAQEESEKSEDTKSDVGDYAYSHKFPAHLRQYLKAELLYSAARQAKIEGLFDAFTRQTFYNYGKRIEDHRHFTPWQFKNFAKYVTMAINEGIM
jgi:curved DNA-binding protein CbpA